MKTSKPTILFLFNSSDYAVRPWIDDGRFNVVSVDYSDTDHAGAHTEPQQGHNVANIDLSSPWALPRVWSYLETMGFETKPALVLSFAPCTDLAVSGAAHFAKKKAADPYFQHKAVRLARLATMFNAPYMIENPVSVLATMWRKPDHYWHPHEYSGYIWNREAAHPEFPDIIPAYDNYKKKTGAWCGNGFVMPMKIDRRIPMDTEVNPGHQKLGGKSARTKYIRSLTPRGFACAVYLANADNVANA